MKCDSSTDTRILTVLILILWTLHETRGVPVSRYLSAVSGQDETLEANKTDETRLNASGTSGQKLPLLLIKRIPSRNRSRSIAKLFLQQQEPDKNNTLVVTAFTSETVVLKCFDGNDNVCSNKENCQIRWFQAEKKKYFQEIHAYDRGNPSGERWARKKGKFAKNVSRIGTKLVLEMVGSEDSGMYACQVRVRAKGKRKDLEDANLLGEAKEEFVQMFLLRVFSQTQGGGRGEDELGGNSNDANSGMGQSEAEMLEAGDGNATSAEADNLEHGSAPPVTLKFGMIKYVFSLGSILANLAFFGVVISVLSCLCCGSFCCC